MSKGGYHGGSTVIHAGSGWVGRGSVTSQPADKPKRAPAPSKPKPKKKAKKGSLGVANKGNGLTIAEIVAKAAQKVRALENEIAKARKRLTVLESDLARAKVDADATRNLPRKSALGAALHEAGKAKPVAVPVKPSTKPAKPKGNSGKQSDAERKAEREARERYRSAPKEVAVEHRVGGVIVSKRTVERS